MGSLPPDEPCGWCGRRGTGYIPDGIHPADPLCGKCIWGGRDRQEVKYWALYVIVHRNFVGHLGRMETILYLVAAFL